jgi:hypothetical protein
MKTPVSVFDAVTKSFDAQAVWQQIGTAQSHRCHCDDGDGILAVAASLDGDMWLCLYPGRNQMSLQPGFRARTWNGGGRKERVRKALMLLALAISEDDKR